MPQHGGLLAWKVPPESPNPVPECHNCYCKIPIPRFTQITLNWGLDFLLLHPSTGKLFKPHHTDSNGNHLPVANLSSHMVTAHSSFPSREHLLLTSTAFFFVFFFNPCSHPTPPCHAAILPFLIEETSQILSPQKLPFGRWPSFQVDAGYSDWHWWAQR